MPTSRTITIALVVAGSSMIATVSAPAEQSAGYIEVTGDYRYTLQTTESLADAKSLTCREAWRQAFLTSPLYREQTASVVDADLLHNLVDSLAARYSQHRQIIEETERRRTVSCRVRGTVPKDDMTIAIRTHLAGGVPAAPDIEQNRALRILSAREESGSILIEYQALKRLDWLGTHYQGSLRESADIMVDFYDEAGVLMNTERHAARRTPAGDDVMNPGSVAILKIAKPSGSKTFRVWLVK